MKSYWPDARSSSIPVGAGVIGNDFSGHPEEISRRLAGCV